jgi:arabinofuranosyltransferase
MGYYGALVPNTYFAKEGGRAWWGQGWRYLSDFVDAYWLWLPLIVLAAMLVVAVRQRRHHQSRREHLVIAGLPLAGLLYATAVVRVGGDFMHARLLLPAFVLLLAPVAVIPLNRANAFALLVVPWAAIAIVGMRPKAVDLSAGINDLRAFSVTVSGRAHPVTDVDWGYGRGGRYAIRTDPLHRVYYSATGPVDVAGHALAPVAGQRRPVVVAFAIGALGYSLGPGYTVLDALGLADPIDARFAIGDRGRRPGHEKVMPPAWIWARVAGGDQTPDPSAFPVGKVYVADRAPTLLAQPNGVSYASMANAARAALTCPAVRQLQQASTDALTPARFFENALHSVTDFNVRIPANPLDAQHC